jgi:hypothetical protein
MTKSLTIITSFQGNRFHENFESVLVQVTLCLIMKNEKQHDVKYLKAKYMAREARKYWKQQISHRLLICIIPGFSSLSVLVQ